MDRINEHSLYSVNTSSKQIGGSTRSKSPTKTYKPADIDGDTASALDKFRKANRLLQKELEDTKQALDKEKQVTAKLRKQVEFSKFNLL